MYSCNVTETLEIFSLGHSLLLEASRSVVHNSNIIISSIVEINLQYRLVFIYFYWSNWTLYIEIIYVAIRYTLSILSQIIIIIIIIIRIYYRKKPIKYLLLV